jgi:nucleotide-binding universal stress UspA family protein
MEPTMLNVHKILVPVDFSEHTSPVLRVAADLALKYEASLTLVHVNDLVVTLAPYPPLPPKILDQVATDARVRIDKFRDEALALGARSVDTAIVYGHPTDEIVRFAEEGQFDWIVLGTHGRSGLNRVMVGSVAERVVRTARRPVLTVPLRSSAAKTAAKD